MARQTSTLFRITLALLSVILIISKGNALPIQERHFLDHYAPVIFENNADENIAANEAANTNQLDVEALNAAQTANTCDHEAANTLLISKRHFLGHYAPVIFENNADERIAANEAANTNQLDVEALNAAQTANTCDHETATTLLISKRHFLDHYAPVLFVNNADEDIAANEAANTNQLDIEALNAAQTANTCDHEKANTLLISKRHFLDHYAPLIFENNADEDIAAHEASTTNQLDIEAFNAAQTANTFDHEAANTLLISKRHFLDHYAPVLFENNADEDIAAHEAATTNQLDVEALNAAQAANTCDHETANTLLIS